MDDLGREETHGSPDLLHLLTCEACRSLAIGRLLARQSAPGTDDTREEIYANIWDRLEQQTPELIAQSQQRREAVERLWEELMQAAPGQRQGLLSQACFLNLDLLDHLLEESHARQLGEPATAAELAELAVVLTRVLGGEEQASIALPRALCLAANARRLEGRPLAAEGLLAQVGPFLAGPMERGFYCRTLALVRWEQGRRDEAEALLQHAACLSDADGLRSEVGVCLTLLGLVLHLDGGHGNALSLLSRGWAEIDRDRQPLLALRGGLALASCLAEVGQGERTRSVLGEAWRLYSRVSDPAEMLRVYWAEARALARMGKPDEALPVLEAVWRQLVAEPSPAEAVLVTADLVLALAQVDRRQEIAARLAALESAFPADPALALGAETMQVLARLALEGEPKLRQGVNGTVVTLRRAFRAWGLWIKPLPVA